MSFGLAMCLGSVRRDKAEGKRGEVGGEWQKERRNKGGSGRKTIGSARKTENGGKTRRENKRRNGILGQRGVTSQTRVCYSELNAFIATAKPELHFPGDVIGFLPVILVLDSHLRFREYYFEKDKHSNSL